MNKFQCLKLVDIKRTKGTNELIVCRLQFSLFGTSRIFFFIFEKKSSMNFYSYKIRQGVDNFKIIIFRRLRGARGHELDGAVHVPGVSWLFGFQVG